MNRCHSRPMIPSAVASFALLVRASIPTTVNPGISTMRMFFLLRVSLLFYFHYFFFFRLAHVFHLLNFTVGKLLDFIHRALLLVLGDFFISECLLDRVIPFTAYIAHCGAMIFKHLVQMLHHFPSTFFS